MAETETEGRGREMEAEEEGRGRRGSEASGSGRIEAGYGSGKAGRRDSLVNSHSVGHRQEARGNGARGKERRAGEDTVLLCLLGREEEWPPRAEPI